jgi:hypothetical protein
LGWVIAVAVAVVSDVVAPPLVAVKNPKHEITALSESEHDVQRKLLFLRAYRFVARPHAHFFENGCDFGNLAVETDPSLSTKSVEIWAR